ncbi:spore-associated protein A [Streptomyces liangshanensis]|uniref:spore-associated protein A n=1 Tax=Streptomyces liangshanensis TaxID=2717324 RepID=UPI001FBA8832|nr:spore-associated protein A [Streptomyces liangshanensis]
MRKSRRAAMAAVLTALAVGGATTALAQPATAAPAAAAAQAAYNGVCGSGYNVVNSADIGKQGTVYLTYNAKTGKNCAVTIRKTSGAPVSVFTYLGVSETGASDFDSGNYTSYAGPVYVYGKGYCVDWAGGITNQEVWTYGSNCGARVATRVTKTDGATLRSKVAEPSATVAGGTR